jgi:hypothetical protein
VHGQRDRAAETPTMSPLRTVMIAALATVPLACVVASGAGLSGAATTGAGLAGLAMLTLASERWRSASRQLRAEAADLVATPGATNAAH